MVHVPSEVMEMKFTGAHQGKPVRLISDSLMRFPCCIASTHKQSATCQNLVSNEKQPNERTGQDDGDNELSVGLFHGLRICLQGGFDDADA